MSRSNYAVSDFLVDRHPANQEPFSGVVNPKENTVAYGSRAIPKLVTLLGTDLNEKERIDALRNVLSLDFAHQETKISAVQQGVVESMKNCLKDESTVVRAMAAEVLGKLATLKQAQDSIVETGALTILIDLLKDISNVSTPVCNTLHKFASNPNGCTVLIKYNTISHLVPLLTRPHQADAIVVPCLETISSLTSTSDEAILQTLESNVLATLKELISFFPTLVLKCICNIAKHMKGKDAIVSAGMIPIFGQCVHNSDPSIQLLSLSALMLLCVLSSAKMEASQIPSLLDDLIYILVANLDEKEVDELKFKYAKITLNLISEYPAGKKQIDKCISKYGGDKEASLQKSLFSK